MAIKRKKVIIDIKSVLDASGIKGMVSGLKKIKDAANRVRASIGGMVDGFRQLTQGLLSVGRAMTFFVSIPLVAFLKSAYESAIEFEQQMVRVKKVMGAAQYPEAVFKDLEAFFREASTVSIAAPEEFAQFAEQFAQAGATGIPALKELVVLADVFGNAVDGIPLENVARQLSSLANSFGVTLAGNIEIAVAWLHNAAETLNALENQTGTNAGKMITALQDVGAIYSRLEVPFHVVAGWAALGEQAGMSADEVGTALKNIPTFIAQNIDKFQDLTSTTGIWNSVAEARNAFETDFADALTQTVLALSENDSQLTAMADSVDIFSRRSAKLIQILVAQADATALIKDENGEVIRTTTEYLRVLGIAEAAYRDGNSLMYEYEQVLQSTGAQVKILQNTIKTLALAIGDDLLPVIAESASKAVPFIKALTSLFVDLSDKTKKTIITMIGLFAVIGPAAFFFNQIAFGLILAAQGFAKILGVIPALIGFVGVLLGQLIRFNPIVILLTSVIVGMFQSAQGSVMSLVDMIAGVLKGLAEQAEKWGLKLTKSYAEGISSGANFIIRGLNVIIQAISDFIQAFSAPKKGPLSNIIMWGQNLMKGWMEGMLSADFSILKKITGVVAGIFNALTFTSSTDSSAQLEGRKKALLGIIGFREKLAEILSVFREVGSVTEEMLDGLVSGLGDASDEVKKLIKDFLKYESIIAKIRNLENNRNKVLGDYASTASAIGADDTLSAEEKVELLAEAGKARDDELRIINAEINSLDKEAEKLQDNLDLQQEMLSANLNKRLLLLRIAAFKAKVGMVSFGMAVSALFKAIFTGDMTDLINLEENVKKTLNADEVFGDFYDEAILLMGELGADGVKEITDQIDTIDFSGVDKFKYGPRGQKWLIPEETLAGGLSEGLLAIAEGFTGIFDAFDENTWPKIMEAFSLGFSGEGIGEDELPIIKLANGIGQLGAALAENAPAIIQAFSDMGMAFLDLLLTQDEAGNFVVIDTVIDVLEALTDFIQFIADNNLADELIYFIGALKLFGPALAGLAIGTGFGKGLGLLGGLFGGASALGGKGLAIGAEGASGSWLIKALGLAGTALVSPVAGAIAAVIVAALGVMKVAEIATELYNVIVPEIEKGLGLVKDAGARLWEEEFEKPIANIGDLFTFEDEEGKSQFGIDLGKLMGQEALDAMLADMAMKEEVRANMKPLGFSMVQGIIAGWKESSPELYAEIYSLAVKLGLIGEGESWINEFSGIGQGIIDGIEKGVNAKFPGFITKFRGQMNRIIATAKAVYMTESPSRVFEDIGYNIVAGLEVGIAGEIPRLTEIANATFEALYANAPGASGDGRPNVNIDFNDTTVRDDSDLDRIADEVLRIVNENADNRMRY